MLWYLLPPKPNPFNSQPHYKLDIASELNVIVQRKEFDDQYYTPVELYPLCCDLCLIKTDISRTCSLTQET